MDHNFRMLVLYAELLFCLSVLNPNFIDRIILWCFYGWENVLVPNRPASQAAVECSALVVFATDFYCPISACELGFVCAWGCLCEIKETSC